MPFLGRSEKASKRRIVLNLDFKERIRRTSRSGSPGKGNNMCKCKKGKIKSNDVNTGLRDRSLLNFWIFIYSCYHCTSYMLL